MKNQSIIWGGGGEGSVHPNFISKKIGTLTQTKPKIYRGEQICPLPRSNRAEANRVKNSEVTTLDKICRVSSNCAGSKLCRRDMKYEKVGVLKMNVLALNSYTYFKLSLAGNVVFPISNF